jgi:hypothetical protein
MDKTAVNMNLSRSTVLLSMDYADINKCDGPAGLLAVARRRSHQDASFTKTVNTNKVVLGQHDPFLPWCSSAISRSDTTSPPAQKSLGGEYASSTLLIVQQTSLVADLEVYRVKERQASQEINELREKVKEMAGERDELWADAMLVTDDNDNLMRDWEVCEERNKVLEKKNWSLQEQLDQALVKVEQLDISLHGSGVGGRIEERWDATDYEIAIGATKKKMNRKIRAINLEKEQLEILMRQHEEEADVAREIARAAIQRSKSLQNVARGCASCRAKGRASAAQEQQQRQQRKRGSVTRSVDSTGENPAMSKDECSNSNSSGSRRLPTTLQRFRFRSNRADCDTTEPEERPAVGGLKFSERHTVSSEFIGEGSQEIKNVASDDRAARKPFAVRSGHCTAESVHRNGGHSKSMHGRRIWDGLSKKLQNHTGTGTDAADDEGHQQRVSLGAPKTNKMRSTWHGKISQREMKKVLQRQKSATIEHYDVEERSELGSSVNAEAQDKTGHQIQESMKKYSTPDHGVQSRRGFHDYTSDSGECVMNGILPKKTSLGEEEEIAKPYFVGGERWVVMSDIDELSICLDAESRTRVNNTLIKRVCSRAADAAGGRVIFSRFGQFVEQRILNDPALTQIKMTAPGA